MAKLTIDIVAGGLGIEGALGAGLAISLLLQKMEAACTADNRCEAPKVICQKW